MFTRTCLLLASALMLATLASGPAGAGFVTGRDLLASCSPHPADPVYRLKVAECRGYVIAVADSSECDRRNVEFKWNSAMNSSQRDLVETVVKWLHTHPAMLPFQADGLVAAALSEAYPCNDVTASGSGAP